MMLISVMTFGVMQLALAENVSADTTPQPLPFMQDWTNIGLITVNDNWSMVPGVTGYLGDYRTTPGGKYDFSVRTAATGPEQLALLKSTGGVEYINWACRLMSTFPVTMTATESSIFARFATKVQIDRGISSSETAAERVRRQLSLAYSRIRSLQAITMATDGRT